MPVLKKTIASTNAHISTIFDGVTDGFEPFALAKLSSEIARDRPLVYIMRDGTKIADLQQALSFIEPNLPIFQFPAWDCLPYDRASPGVAVSARRISTLACMLNLCKDPRSAIILTTANAIIQKLPPCTIASEKIIHTHVGQRVCMSDLVRYLECNGFERTTVVRDVGEFAVRGGILDIFSPGEIEPFRLDFFGDTLETIRVFDSATQRTIANRNDFFCSQ